MHIGEDFLRDLVSVLDAVASVLNGQPLKPATTWSALEVWLDIVEEVHVQLVLQRAKSRKQVCS